MDDTEQYNKDILNKVYETYDKFRSKPYYERTMKKAMDKAEREIEKELNVSRHGEIDRIKMRLRLQKKLEERKKK